MSQTLDKVLTASIQKGDDGFFIIRCEEYPQLLTQGKTIEESIFMLKDLIQFALDFSDPQFQVVISKETVTEI